MAFLTTGTVGPGYCSATDTFVSLVPTGGGPPIGGSGTTGYLPVFSASRTLGNSLLRQASGNLFMPTSGSVAIGLDIDTPPLGILELVSSSKGFVPPKVTTTQRDAMSPFAGWQIHNTTTTRPSWYSGTAWVEPVDNTTTQTIAGAKTFSTGPVFSTPLLVPSGGTGLTSATAYALLAGGTTSTGAFQSLAGVGTTGQVLTSNGAGALPTFQAAAGGTAFAVRFVDPYPATSGRTFTNLHESAGSGMKHYSGWGVCPGTGADCATTTADSTWELVAWDIPPVLPSGTATLRCWAIANDASGVAKVNWKWNTCAAEVDCSGVTLNAEGTSTVTWSTGDADQLKQLDITMDASTVTAGQPIVGKLVFEATGWTETKVSTWNCSIVWLQ